ncbi:ATP synthase subunit s, mitochondrial isoform X1 [Contarinia nasturtii]|uniref:ATP synthase subunit s, mitochondrial isoform X1 n=1 Tax=Contarinia nasturtii TaxID=265458 RepID=UPI0012D46188|nr:ATP synthase subunit s, mitochondrial isoform X1 [Contarinia nasturtii]
MMTSKLICTAFGDFTMFNSSVNRQMRSFFAYLRVAFNKVDTQRLEEVGPNQLCAEWILKNGGSVQFHNQYLPIKEYNSLSNTKSEKIKVVDGTDSSIMALGFEHFKGCKNIEQIILNRCKHMENEALEQLGYVKNSLNELQITDCPNVVESGLMSLKQLNNLKKLTIYNFIYIKDFTGVVNQLKKDLPNCEIHTTKQL